MSAFTILDEMGIISKEVLKTALFFEGVLDEKLIVMLLLILGVIMLGSYWIMLKRVFYIGIPMKLRKNIEYDDWGNVLETENQ